MKLHSFSMKMVSLLTSKKTNPILLLAVIVFYLLVGTIGHDPWWKRGEAYSFGIIYHFYVTGTWLIPIDAGTSFMEKPPLYYWVAIVFCHLLGGILPLHDAARLSSFFFMIISTAFVFLTAKTLYHQRANALSLALKSSLLFLTTYGLTRYGHTMLTDVALLSGSAISLYGLALWSTRPNNWFVAGIWIGLGVGVTFMTKGILLPGILGLSAFSMLITAPELRHRATLKATLIALLVASPFLLIWPTLVYQHSPTLFWQWLWENNIGRFTGASVEKLGAENRPGYFLWMAPIFGFPCYLLALWRILRDCKDWRSADYLLPASYAFIVMAILLISASGRAPYLLPLLPAIAILCIPVLSAIPTKLNTLWNSLTRIGFTAAVMAVWALWWGLLHPDHQYYVSWLLHYYEDVLPLDYIPAERQVIAPILAILVTTCWALFMLRSHKETATDTVFNWFAGTVAFWCTLSLLLMPWIDRTRSFRIPLTQIVHYVENSSYADACIGNYNLGENIAPMMQYFTYSNLPLRFQNWDQATCPLILTFVEKAKPAELHPNWKLIWTESEIKDIKNMEVRLYERKH